MEETSTNQPHPQMSRRKWQWHIPDSSSNKKKRDHLLQFIGKASAIWKSIFRKLSRDTDPIEGPYLSFYLEVFISEKDHCVIVTEKEPV